MTKLTLTQAEYDELKSIRTYEKNRTLLGVLENELELLIVVDDTAAAAERTLVLATPRILRTIIPVTPKVYYELSLLVKGMTSGALYHLMHHATGSSEVGFPTYIAPSKSILNAQHSMSADQLYLFTFSGARPFTDVNWKLYYTTPGSGQSGTVTADADGNGTFTATSIDNNYSKVELTQTVLAESEDEAPYNIVYDSIHRIKQW